MTQAEYRINFCVSNSSPEDYRLCYDEINWPAPENEMKSRKGIGPTIECPMSGGAPIHIRRHMTEEIIDWDYYDNYLWTISEESSDEEVTGTVIFLHCIDVRLRSKLIEWGWYFVPLHRWRIVFESALVSLRRTGIFGDIKDDGVYELRKLFKLTYRRDEEADWDNEWKERRSKVIHKISMNGKKKWITMAKEAMVRTCRRMVFKMGSIRALETLDDWWKSRHHATPAGATGLRSKYQGELRKDERMKGSDRANKKAISEFLDDDQMIKWLMEEPANIARCSTKPEPGGKQRALYASEDREYNISAYSSAHMEKELNFDGMCGKQKPKDVVDWTLKSFNRKLWWLSADYSDFNKEHEMVLMKELNEVMCCQWARYGHPTVRRDKMLTSAWLAQSYDRSFVKIGTEKSSRVISGLYSGHRNTARDNTMLHRIYSDVAYEDAELLGFKIKAEYEAICGDDEDFAFRKWWHAGIYVKLLQLQGHKINPVKQLAGFDTHEFLQLLMLKNKMPERPLASILSTLVTGNWYTEQGVWYDSAVSSASSNFYDCVCRGMDIFTARQLCANYLDLYMRAKYTEEEYKEKGKQWHDMEWYKYRMEGGGKYLWYGTKGKTGTPLKLIKKIKPRKNWPSKATDAWMEKMSPFLKGLRESRIDEYRNHLLAESMNSTFHSYRMDEMCKLAKEVWPEREKIEYDIWAKFDVKPMSIKKWLVYMNSSMTRLGAPTEEEVFARIGLDVEIVNIVGRAKIMENKIKPEYWMRYANVIEKEDITMEESLANTAFRSLAAVHKGYLRQFKRSKDYKLKYVYGPAGSGKTWLSSFSNKIMDVDVWMYQLVGWKKRKDSWEKDCWRSTERMFMRVIYRAMQNDVNIICGQWPIGCVIETCKAIGIDCECMILEVDREKQEQRLIDRGYSKEKIEKYRRYEEKAIQGYELKACSYKDVLNLV